MHERLEWDEVSDQVIQRARLGRQDAVGEALAHPPPVETELRLSNA